MDYKQKYLKYKNKYLQLKQRGGTKEEIEAKIKKLEPRCSKTSFSQHKGECWNDALLTLVCYSDEIKESVQNKLLNLTPREIIDLAYYNNREKYLPPIYRRSSTDYEQQIIASKFEKRLIKYLTLLQQRLCMHIDGEKPICILEEGSSCILEDFNKFLVEETDSRERTLKRTSSIISGIGTAYMGSKIAFEKPSVLVHPGTNYIIQLVFCILSFCLLDNDEIFIPNSINYDKLKKEDLIDVFAIHTNTSNHATGFYTCNEENLFYNDILAKYNPNFKYVVDWKPLLEKCIEDKKELFINTGNYIFLKKNNDYTKILYDGKEENINIYELSSEEKFSESDQLKTLYLLKKMVMTNDKISSVLNDLFIMAELKNGSLKNIKDINMSYDGYESLIIFSIHHSFNLFVQLLDKEDLIIPEYFIHKILDILAIDKYAITAMPILFYDAENKIIKLFNAIKNSKYKYLFFENSYTGAQLIENLLKKSKFYPFKIINYLLDNDLIDVNKKINKDTTLIDLYLKKILTDPIYELQNNEYFKTELYYYAEQNNKKITSQEIFIEIIKKYNEQNYVTILRKIIEKTKNINDTEHILCKFIDKNLFILLCNLIKKGANVNDIYYGSSVLEKALKLKIPNQFIMLLLNSDIDIDAKTFYYFIGKTYDPMNYNILHRMIEVVKKPNSLYLENSILYYMITNNYPLELIKLLIEKGADVNFITTYGNKSLLCLAIEESNNELGKLLIEKGADVNSITTYGNKSLLYLAIEKSNNELGKLLIEKGADVNFITTYFDKSLLYLAIEKSNNELGKLLIEKGADVNFIKKNTYGDESLLYLAIEKSNNELGKLLIEKGADVNFIKKNTYGDKSLLYLAIEKSNNELGKLLIEKGADVNFTSNGGSLLKMAQKKENLGIIELLNKYGVASS
jgi:ankyrin repeat protein